MVIKIPVEQVLPPMKGDSLDLFYLDEPNVEVALDYCIRDYNSGNYYRSYASSTHILKGLGRCSLGKGFYRGAFHMVAAHAIDFGENCQ
jgi:hypothetical protein